MRKLRNINKVNLRLGPSPAPALILEPAKRTLLESLFIKSLTFQVKGMVSRDEYLFFKAYNNK
jgi:hypothetical protein